jgi:tRNA modification GTPase
VGPAVVQDVIAAIATPAGRGGVGIVRVSGADLRTIVTGLVGREPRERVATLATFRGAGGEALDQGLVLFFRGPGSFTGEDVLELQGHGSPVALRLVLARCLALGARLAQPGEFTRRAFLNGKLDLAQAESVADLIDAATATAARAALRSLAGEFSREVHALVEGVTHLRMLTEATLDFPEEDLEFLKATDAAGQLARLRETLAALLGRASAGARLASGLAIVLVGRPNVGKSSLLNRLVREDAAIVTPIAGTTRDTVERPVELAGIPLTIIDTAGLRATADEVERQGIERTRAAIGRADLALVLVDAREAADALHADDQAILDSLPATLPRLVVHNKADLAGIAPHVEQREGRTHLWMSALTGAGVERLESEVLTLAGLASVGEDAFIARERHLEALRRAQAFLDEAGAQLASSAPALELFAESLREAQEALSSITGEFTADDLLGVIFSRFCIGK